MSTSIVNRNNVVAGVFLVVSILLAVAISFVLSDIQGKFGSKTTYVFRFPTAIGVHGLQAGAKVTYGGLQVGTVDSIEPYVQTDADLGQAVTVAYDVVVSVTTDLVLFEDAYADLLMPMLGGISKINIPSAGTGSYEGGPIDSNVMLDENEVLRGRYAPSILAQLGFSTEESDKLKVTIDDMSKISANLDETVEGVLRMAKKLEPDFGSGVDDGKSVMANLRTFSNQLNGVDGELGWSGRVDGILADVKEGTVQVGPTIEDARATIGDARAMITDNKANFSRIMGNAAEISERVRFDTIGRLDGLLDKGSLALGSYKKIATDVDELILVNRPKIDSTLDSVRDIGVQGNLFVEELRAQPWRLLKKPSSDDLMREPIYEAARAYASAVSDLRVASQALDSAVGLAQDQGSATSAMEIARIAKIVDDAYGRYELAERGLLERLRTQEP